jgi:hypothetical protein
MMEYRENKMKSIGDGIEKVVKESIGKEGFVAGATVLSKYTEFIDYCIIIVLIS